MTCIKVTNTSADGLDEMVWRFSQMAGLEFALDEAEIYTRPTRRHKLRRTRFWGRIYNRTDNTMDKPEVPTWVLEHARERIISQIKITS